MPWGEHLMAEREALTIPLLRQLLQLPKTMKRGKKKVTPGVAHIISSPIPLTNISPITTLSCKGVRVVKSQLCALLKLRRWWVVLLNGEGKKGAKQQSQQNQDSESQRLAHTQLGWILNMKDLVRPSDSFPLISPAHPSFYRFATHTFSFKLLKLLKDRESAYMSYLTFNVFPHLFYSLP